MKNISKPFEPRAKLLLELGNQLIKDEGIALFELVKNAYDADATETIISMYDVDKVKEGKIVITDNGSGMNWETVTTTWLEPGTDYRQLQIHSKKRSSKFNRPPLGQKGIGRFGAHKLGGRIQLVTRSKDQNEIVVSIDWNKFESSKYLKDVPVNIAERKPEVFVKSQTGTQLIITNLWHPWDRGMFRAVHRAIQSISSPFSAPDSFKTILRLEERDKQDWLKGLMVWKDVFKYRLYEAEGNIVDNKFNYSYKFLPWRDIAKLVKERKESKTVSLKTNLAGYKIGKVFIKLYIYDLDSEILASVKEKQLLRDFLKFNGGIRVYRDHLRVYDYGEPGNDWLQLGTRRVNSPTEKFSNNLILGEVHIGRTKSTDLIEKTNREGFIENEAVVNFRNAIIEALVNIEAERNTDKIRLRAALGKTQIKEPVLDSLSRLRSKIEKKKLIKDYGSYLDRIENDYKNIKEKLLTSAGAGLSLSIVIHEIEKLIHELIKAVTKEKTNTRIKILANRLSELVEGYSLLIKNDDGKNNNINELIRQALFNVEYRLSGHHIKLLQEHKAPSFKVKCSRRLILGALMNIIDNSIWWLDNKSPKEKYLYIAPSMELSEGPAVIIGDNGSGFIDELEFVTQPFFTRKPEGMGLGLHITNEIMKAHNGSFKILKPGVVKLPKQINGAAVALVFNNKDTK